jgi:hypothetical protein
MEPLRANVFPAIGDHLIPAYRIFDNPQDREDLARIWNIPVERIPSGTRSRLSRHHRSRRTRPHQSTLVRAGSMIGEIGALGGGILPNLLGQAKQHTGSYGIGFIVYAALALSVLEMLASFPVDG